MSQESKIKLFLSLKDFDEYMEHFEDLIGMPYGSVTFRKEMQLMESDTYYTHRKKDTLRNAKIREVLKSLEKKIKILCDDMENRGYWIPVIDFEPDVAVTYHYPNGKNGDINHAAACSIGKPDRTDDDIYRICIPASDYRLIELIGFQSRNLSGRYDFESIENDPQAIFLNKYSRFFQLLKLMRRVNYFRPRKYRNLRSIDDRRLRDIIKKHQDEVSNTGNAIYEALIAEGKTNARWISEQKAYAIIRKTYPDAVFQYVPDWLHGQRLDIYIPSKKTAIEYQGKQHTEAVDFFGGEEGLKDNIQRDKKKRYWCRQNNVRLLYWSYSDPLTKEFFNQEIRPAIDEER